MNGPDRYKALRGPGASRDEVSGASSLDGLDPVTGLPVLIYEFEGEPLTSVADLESENIPRILWSGSEEGRGRVVAALSLGWKRLADDPVPLTPARLLDAARALHDAASLGLVHGDLRPERLLLAGDRLLLEGYGVPWLPEPGRFRAPEIEEGGTLPGDVWSLAAVVAEIGVTARDETVVAVLELCSAEDPLERPSAEELYLALEALVDQLETEQTTILETGPEVGGTAAVPAIATDDAQPEGRRNIAEAYVGEPGADEAGAEEPGAEEPGAGKGVAASSDIASSDIASINNASTDNASSSSARPRPPGASGPDDAGTLDDGGDRRRRLALLGVLMAAVVVLALLAMYGPRGSVPPASPTLENTIYVVEVAVEPQTLPPVAIHLITSPPGSSLARGDTLGTAPRHLALDLPGTWAFQGRLQDRRSPVVTIQVPEERSLTLTIPP
ncbi:MAG: hypothetical protein WD273_07400 [Trueperaceae bacterium]